MRGLTRVTEAGSMLDEGRARYDEYAAIISGMILVTSHGSMGLAWILSIRKNVRLLFIQMSYSSLSSILTLCNSPQIHIRGRNRYSSLNSRKIYPKVLEY
jgi:hypothetical protein